MARKRTKNCPVCGGDYHDEKYKLEDCFICRSCMEYMRFAFPVIHIPVPDTEKYRTVDLMEEAELTEFKESVEHAEEIRNRMLRNFDDYDHVFTVELVAPSQRRNIKDGIPQMLRFLGTIHVYGRMQLGSLRIGDRVKILRDGKVMKEADIMETGYFDGCTSAGEMSLDFRPSGRSVEEGYAAHFTLSAEADGIMAGDLIVMDD